MKQLNFKHPWAAPECASCDSPRSTFIFRLIYLSTISKFRDNRFSFVNNFIQTLSIFFFYYFLILCLSSVLFSRWVMCNSLWPHEVQHDRHPCPSTSPGVHPNPCPLSQWCHQTVSSSVVTFSSCPQSFPASGPFQMSQLSHQMTKVLEFQLQHQSFQWTPWTDLL